MLKFLKYVLATLVGLSLFFFFGFLFLVGIAAASGGSKETKVSANSVLKLNLNYDIPEKTNTNPFAGIDLGNFKPSKAIGLYDLILAIRKAKTDNNIKGIYIPMGINMNGLATLTVLREELKEFKKSGKFIYAFGNTVSQKSYYVSAVSDKLFLNPSGGMEMTGFGREIMYYKNALEKLGVEVQDFHCGAFKSAIEPYLRDKMSDANRVQLKNIYQDVYNGFLKEIAADRKMDTATLNQIVNNLTAFLPEDALQNKLVDQLSYYDEVESAMKTKLGLKPTAELKMVDMNAYANTLEKDISGNKIAVIMADGEIKDGEGKEGEIGGDEYAKMIRKMREDDKIKAIVLRVNSPGGSALASDIIWRELQVTKKTKPVIVSFGNVAASGGYFIATAGEKIFAQSNTITGSIGVFGLIPNIKKLLNEKLGITTDQVAVTKHGALSGINNPLDAEEKAMIQRNIEKTYREFKGKVAEARKKDTAYIETIAQGHVWTGNQGIANGLVDEIGTLDDALKYAAQKANLKDYSVKLYPQDKSFAEQIAESFGETKENFIKEELGDQYVFYKTLKSIKTNTGIQMRMLYSLD